MAEIMKELDAGKANLHKTPSKYIPLHREDHLSALELLSGLTIEIINEAGEKVVSFYRNRDGNQVTDRSYTLQYPDGRKVILPFGMKFSLALPSFSVAIEGDGGLFFSQVLPNLQYQIAPIIQKPTDTDQVIGEVVFLSEWKEVTIDDDCFLDCGGNGKRLYKVPGRQEYFLRDSAGRIEARISGQNPSASIDGLLFKIEEGKFMIKGDSTMGRLLVRKMLVWKTEAGKDTPKEGVSGTLYGGRRFHFGTFRELGRVKPAYGQCNEDAVGVNQAGVAVFDGMGGYLHGHLIAALGAEVFAHSREKNIQGVVKDVHQQAQEYVTYYDQKLARDESEALPISQRTHLPNAVMAAVQFEGNKLKTMLLGDCRVNVVRGDKIAFRSSVHSVYHDDYRRDRVSEDKLDEREVLKYAWIDCPTTALLNKYNADTTDEKGEVIVGPHYQEFDLLPGDRIVVMSDGGVMPDDKIIICVQAESAQDAYLNLIEEKECENNGHGGMYPVRDGKHPEHILIRTRDNATYFVIEWD